MFAKVAVVLCLGFVFLIPTDEQYVSSSRRKTYTHAGSQLVKFGLTLESQEKGGFVEQSIRFAIDQANAVHPDLQVSADINYVQPGNIYEASRKLCQSLAAGVAIQFLPKDPTSAALFQQACDRLDLLCLDIYQRGPTFSAATFTLQPSTAVLGMAVVDLLRHHGLNRSAAIIDGPEDIPRLDAVIWYGRPHNVSVQFYFKNSANYRHVLHHLRSEGVTTFLVAVDDLEIAQFVQNVLQLNMHDTPYTYVFMSLNLWLEDLRDISYIGVNVFALSAIDVVNHANPETVSQMITFAESHRTQPRSSVHRAPVTIPVEPAVFYDSVHLLATALEGLVPLQSDFFAPVSCSQSSRWPYGTTILNYLNAMGPHAGLTGDIQMKSSARQNHALQVMKLTENGLINVGMWSTLTKLEVFAEKRQPDSRKYSRTRAGTAKDPLVIVSILKEPFLMLKEDYRKDLEQKNLSIQDRKDLISKDHVEGFIIDFLDNLAENMMSRDGKPFEYELYLVPDDQFGILNQSTGQWNGMIKEVVDGTATLAVAPIAITASREAAVSFTKPFMTTGIGIMYQAPRGSAPNLFALMRSLSAELWIGSLGAAMVIGVSMWIIARFSPLEWDNRHLCTGIETRFAVNAFNLRNSLWFSICSLMMQGCDINPRAVSTRCLGGFWWFYTLFYSLHFVAKLASVLTVEKMSVPFSGVDQLVEHPEIKYGTIINNPASTTTYEFFRNLQDPTRIREVLDHAFELRDQNQLVELDLDSKISIYAQMFERMNGNPSVLVEDFAGGVAKVTSEKYAFLIEATEIDYLAERNCNVTRIGGTLSAIQYGVAAARDSPWTEKLTIAILNLIELSMIEQMREKWWKRGSVCVKDESTGPSAINSTLVGGAFLILAIGLFIAIVIAGFEFFWNALRNAHVSRGSLMAELALELRHALRFRASSTRPVLQKFCQPCGVKIHSLAAAQSHEHRDYTPMMFLNNAIERSPSVF